MWVTEDKARTGRLTKANFQPLKYAVFRIRIGFNADPDPDPAFYLNANPDPDPNPERQTNTDPDLDFGQTLPSQKVGFWQWKILFM